MSRRRLRGGGVASRASRCALCIQLLLVVVAALVCSGKAAAATAAAEPASSSASSSDAPAAPSPPGVYYFDPPPAVPFNPGQFLTIEEQEAITRVVDGFLRLTGEAGAQPIRVLPGPLVDQPDMRRPGQRWPLPQLPGSSPEQEQQQQQQAAEAVDAARARARDAADGAQAAATRAGTAARSAAAGAANATSDLLRRGRLGVGGEGGRGGGGSNGSSGLAGVFGLSEADATRVADSSRPLPQDLFGGLSGGLSPEAAAAALATRANAAAAAAVSAAAAAGPSPPGAAPLPPGPSPRDLFGNLTGRLRSSPSSNNNGTRRARRRGATRPFSNSSSIEAAAAAAAAAADGAALDSNSTNDGDKDDDVTSNSNPFADAANAASDAFADAAPHPNPIVGTSTTPAGPGQLPQLAFAGGGALFLFYGGVAEGLAQKGLFVPGVSKVSGFSGGALAAAVVASGANPRRLLESYDDSSLFCNVTLPDGWNAPPRTPLQAAATLRSSWEDCVRTATWPINVLGTAVRRIIAPESVSNVSKTATLWASEVSPYFYYAQRSAPLGDFRDVEDVAQKVMASSAVPCAVTPRTYHEIDGRPYIDGGYTTSTNQLCIGATEESPCVTVSATYFGPHGWQPLMRPSNPLLPFGSSTCDDTVLVPPFWGLQARPPVGYGPPFSVPVNTSRYLLDGSLTTRPQVCSVPEMLDFFVMRERLSLPPPGFPGWAINPGKRTPMPAGVSMCDFQGYLMWKANSTISRLIYEHGIAEGKAFAEEVYGK